MFLNAITPKALLTILCAIGATARAGAGDEKIHPVRGLFKALGWALLPWLIVAGGCSFGGYELAEWHACLGGGLAWLGPEVEAAVKKHGVSILSDPRALLREVAPGFLKRVFTPTKTVHEKSIGID